MSYELKVVIFQNKKKSIFIITTDNKPKTFYINVYEIYDVISNSFTIKTMSPLFENACKKLLEIIRESAVLSCTALLVLI